MKYKKLRKLVVLCGGTGGHFYPGLTIAREFQQDKAEAYIIIGGHKDKISKQTEISTKFNVDCYTINSSSISRKPLLFIKFLVNLTKGFFKARRFLKKIKPDAVLGMGSFTSLPVSFAAVSLNIPLYLHDGNAKIGRANVFLSNWARLTMSAFPAVNERVLKSDYICTGMPIRSELTGTQLTKKEAIVKINKFYKVNFKHTNKTILVFGGSQGALTINKVLPLVVNQIESENLQVIHLFGNNINVNPYKNTTKQSLVLNSSDKMDLLYSVTDLVVSRSGGSTIAELEYFKKTAILIPLPFATGLHQNDNAEYYIKKSDSVMLLNKHCTLENVNNLVIKKLHEDKEMISERTCEENVAERILINIEENI
jgi:UDP-N-acetylglucosamine--N-acetylmuramyl-(pentapeptide) pyrophosphoryl-undecaprenol N-acetylglucosamine transferase